MSKISKRPVVHMPTAKEDKAITAAARSDPGAQPQVRCTSFSWCVAIFQELSMNN